MIRPGALLPLLLVVSSLAAASEVVEISAVAHKIVEPADDEGVVLVSVKATVKNLTDLEQEVDVWIQGIDAEQFEVVEIQLFGRLKPKEARVLTNSAYLREKTYSAVVKWQVEEQPSEDDEGDVTSASHRSSPPRHGARSMIAHAPGL